MNAEVRLERRSHARLTPKGTATLRAQDQTQHGRIANLGQGGIAIETDTEVGPPERWLGRRVEIEIRLDEGHAEWLRGTGDVVRTSVAGLALTFDAPLSAGLLGMLDELATASSASARVMSVVLIDADPQRRSMMANGFRATGCAVIEAATPLEAIIRLGESRFEPDVIAVADSQPSSAAADMRAFVMRYHSNAKLVTIGDELLEPAGLAHWLSSADPGADLARRVREVLVQPRRRTES